MNTIALFLRATDKPKLKQAADLIEEAEAEQAKADREAAVDNMAEQLKNEIAWREDDVARQTGLMDERDSLQVELVQLTERRRESGSAWMPAPTWTRTVPASRTAGSTTNADRSVGRCRGCSSTACGSHRPAFDGRPLPRREGRGPMTSQVVPSARS
jgi:hypothetical protein